jgi:sporulation protein YlmC with PRC-barrel domain
MTRFAWMVPALLAAGLTTTACGQPLLSGATDPAQWQGRLGQPVYTADGQASGTIAGFITDPVSGRPVGAVVRHSRWFGLASREALVPAEQVATVNIDVIVLRWTSAELAAAPSPRRPPDGQAVVWLP